MRTALALFTFGLCLRLLFWLATPDRGMAWNIAFQGDAPLWQELAHKASTGQSDELFRLPLRPPGMLWLVSAIWDGTGSPWLPRLVFAIAGATLAPMIFLLLRAHLPLRTAAGAGLFCAGATNLMLLDSGLHSELPYLLLMLVSLFDQERLRTRATTWTRTRWGALHAALMLLRAEHVLTFVLMLALLLWQRAPRWSRTALGATLSCSLLLVPWHVAMWRQIDAYNDTGAPQLPLPGKAVRGELPWDGLALQRLSTLPAFQQGPTFHFVGETMRARGASMVRAADLDVLREAYGVWPEPLPRPFLCLYGGLNFFLGNTAEAAGGFSQRALGRTPQLQGGPSRYPPGLVRVLPRDGNLALSYPPHLDVVVHGYRRGFAELGSDPTASLQRLLTKLWHGIEGAAGGFGGNALPIGLSGMRRAVDFVTAAGPFAAAFRITICILAIAGLWTLRRNVAAQVWLVFALSKLAGVLAYFGYARQGALCVPTVALGLAAAANRWWLPWMVPERRGSRAAGRLAVGLGLLLLSFEVLRCCSVDLLVDGDDPLTGTAAPRDHAEHVLRYH